MQQQRVDVIGHIVSTNSVIAGRTAAFVVIEVVAENGPLVTHIGSIVLGDLVTLEIVVVDDIRGSTKTLVDVVARRATISFVSDPPPSTTIADPVLPEIVPLLTHANAGGGGGGGATLHQRERVVCQGDQLRLRAIIEPVTGSSRCIVRADLGAVLLDEVLPFSSSSSSSSSSSRPS